MIYLLLTLTAALVTFQTILQKVYNSRCTGGTILFSGMISFFAMLYFIAMNRDWSWNPAILPYSIGFGTAYAAATVYAVLAIKHGSVAQTSLIGSFSLLIPTFYGILLLREPIKDTLIIGIVLLAVSMVLTNYEKSEKKATLKWFIYVMLSFIGNGMCSTVQKAETLYIGPEGSSLFMIVALIWAVVLLMGASLVIKEERDVWKLTVKKGGMLALVSGIANGLCNYLVIYLNPKVPASVMFPVISAGGMVMIFIYALGVQKERFKVYQYIGYAAGVVSIVLLNL